MDILLYLICIGINVIIGICHAIHSWRNSDVITLGDCACYSFIFIIFICSGPIGTLCAMFVAMGESDIILKGKNKITPLPEKESKLLYADRVNKILTNLLAYVDMRGMFKEELCFDYDALIIKYFEWLKTNKKNPESEDLVKWINSENIQ